MTFCFIVPTARRYFLVSKSPHTTGILGKRIGGGGPYREKEIHKSGCVSHLPSSHIILFLMVGVGLTFAQTERHTKLGVLQIYSVPLTTYSVSNVLMWNMG